jgi:hypothetical protein
MVVLHVFNLISVQLDNFEHLSFKELEKVEKIPGENPFKKHKSFCVGNNTDQISEKPCVRIFAKTRNT